MRRFARGVTLTPEERRLVGLDTPANSASYRSSAGLVHGHACSVQLPDGSSCSIEYTRYGPRAHRFAYAAPLCQQVWITETMGNDLPAIEQKAQEVSSQAFRQAQKDEQKQMRRKTPPPGKATTQLERPHMSAQTAAHCAGCYCVCLRFESGLFMPHGTLYEDPDKAVQELAEGVHKDVQLVGGQKLVVAICNRSLRCWQEPRFLALPTTVSSASLEEPPSVEDASTTCDS
jgi:hypothetical protein